MNYLVVVAHPLENSLCRHIADSLTDQLKKQGHSVVVKDLYAEGFDPVLSRSERESYYGAKYDDRAVRADIEQMAEAEALVLIFPTWWFSLPAILKGWFDRVFAPGHAYDHASDFGPIEPRLENLKEVRAITTLGSPWWVDFFILHRPVYKVLRRAIFGTCARKISFKMNSFYKSESPSQQRVDSFVQKLKSQI